MGQTFLSAVPESDSFITRVYPRNEFVHPTDQDESEGLLLPQGRLRHSGSAGSKDGRQECPPYDDPVQGSNIFDGLLMN